MKLTKESKYNEEIVAKIYSRMCEIGIYLDLDKSEEIYNEILGEVDKHNECAVELLDERFTRVNLNSNPQVTEVFIQVFPQLLKYAKKTKSGNYSFKEEVVTKIFEKTGNMFAYHLREYRSKKSIASKVKEIIGFIDENGWVHPEYSHCETNRVHFKKPGLSNMTERIRPIIGTPNGYKLIKVDYRFQEPYILVHMLCIEELKPAFEDGKDFYAEMVKILTGREMAPENRNLTKTIWLAGTYGSELKGLNLSEEDQEFANAVLEKISSITEIIEFKKYLDNEVIAYSAPIESYFGTTREFPSWEPPYRIKNIVFNNTMQITGADFLFFAMESVECKLREHGYSEDEIRIYLTIHDEIMFIAKEEIITDELLNIIKEAMVLDIEGWCKVQLKMSVVDNY